MFGYSLLGLLILIIDIYAIIKTLQSGASTGAKLLWILGILIFPVLGAIVWFFAGPRGGRPITI
ncbi:PLD nuclease N-terminal domain-containing protein [uncultured Cohaesibacter sp.]|uniref:PLD nuclease N-terminal domain-containing protein n=1 Tax=uncultured Cohaesibacter sp. TaxID=1002546 RepID=UPI0029C64A92|nr:PLD nuclease N-terminal domain-containing protein [uncultured Cohaesibacter sp.]